GVVPVVVDMGPVCGRLRTGIDRNPVLCGAREGRTAARGRAETPMIRTRGLTKDFVVGRTRTVHAVRGVDLDVADGELVAVLGPNGAGKTTTIRMLTTLTRPTSGSATVAGHDVVAEPAAVRRGIGYVGQGNGAGHSQRVLDELVSHGRMLGLDRA